MMRSEIELDHVFEYKNNYLIILVLTVACSLVGFAIAVGLIYLVMSIWKG